MLRIGIDFDNTIVNYDHLFYMVAVEQGVVPVEIPVNKIAIRDYLRQKNQESIWTEMQGYVYGARMSEAKAYPGALEFMCAARKDGHELAIMSHKTRYPFLGPQYDLHAAAHAWVEHHLRIDCVSIISEGKVFFELTVEEKLARAADFGCDVFIDDLPEILFAKTFPDRARRVLFDPENNHAIVSSEAYTRCRSWTEIQAALFELC